MVEMLRKEEDSGLGGYDIKFRLNSGFIPQRLSARIWSRRQRVFVDKV